jgi:hypothetical protein
VGLWLSHTLRTRSSWRNSNLTGNVAHTRQLSLGITSGAMFQLSRLDPAPLGQVNKLLLVWSAEYSGYQTHLPSARLDAIYDIRVWVEGVSYIIVGINDIRRLWCCLPFIGIGTLKVDLTTSTARKPESASFQCDAQHSEFHALHFTLTSQSGSL